MKFSQKFNIKKLSQESGLKSKAKPKPKIKVKSKVEKSCQKSSGVKSQNAERSQKK